MWKIVIYISVAFFAAAVIGWPTPEDNDDDATADVISSDPQESTDDQRPGYCKIKDVYIKEGEKAPGPIGKCLKIQCVSASPQRWRGSGCPTFVPGPGCHRTGMDNTKRYPACCPQTVCDGKQSEEE